MLHPPLRFVLRLRLQKGGVFAGHYGNYQGVKQMNPEVGNDDNATICLNMAALVFQIWVKLHTLCCSKGISIMYITIRKNSCIVVHTRPCSAPYHL